jgi:hypothetical protein
MSWIVAFGRFWYDFIVGDSVVLAIGGLATLVLGYLLALMGTAALAQVALPVAVILTIALSLPRQR